MRYCPYTHLKTADFYFAYDFDGQHLGKDSTEFISHGHRDSWDEWGWGSPSGWLSHVHDAVPPALAMSTWHLIQALSTWLVLLAACCARDSHTFLRW